MTLDNDDIEQIARRVAELIDAAAARPGPRYVDASDLAVNPEDVVHPGLLGGWLVSKPPVPRRTPDAVAR